VLPSVYRPIYESYSALGPDRSDSVLRKRIDKFVNGLCGLLRVGRREFDGHYQQQWRERVVDEVEGVVLNGLRCSGFDARRVPPTLDHEAVPEGEVQEASGDGPVLAERQPERYGIQA